MKLKIAAAALCATASISVSAAMAGASIVSTFDDITYWIGEGTNRCAMVIDFNDGGDGNRSFAWGCRWNGEAPTVMEILAELTTDDPRLKMFVSSSVYGSFIEAFAYGDIFPALESHSSVDAETGNYIYSGTSWMLLRGAGSSFGDVFFSEAQNGADFTNPENGEWICWRICSYTSISDPDWNPIGYECTTDSTYTPVAAERSFQMENVRFWVGSGTNECAVVIDFNDGSEGNRSFAWGYRWNGNAPNIKTILDEITAKDKRLKMFASVSEYGSYIEAFAYDADGDGGTFERVWSTSAYAYDNVKSDPDDIFPALESHSSVDAETGNYINSGTSWMLLCGTGSSFGEVSFYEAQNGADFTNPENGEWICWRICSYTSISDPDWNPIGYECDTYSGYVAVAARPSESSIAALPKVGFTTYANLDAAFDAARGGGAVTLPVESSVDEGTKTVTVGTAVDETLQTYEVPAHFDMVVSGGAVSLKLNATAAPTLVVSGEMSEPPFTVSDTTVTVVPGNVIAGLYYGLAVSTDLVSGFSAPTEWVRAENGRVVLEKAKNAAASSEFYKVRVSDVDESAK